MGKVELLSPGGSMTGIRAAVAAGADAIYAGGSLFGARAYADNPDGEDILHAIDFCHLHGAKFYLTVNTLLKEDELKGRLYSYILPLYRQGVDAVLVQDLGVFHFLKENFPDLPLHASTQMTITGACGAALLQKMGASRVVLSRELSLADIRAIRKETDVELETFVHGALCYCYSGQCLMSSLIGGRSGNRGRCAQPCRLPYDLSDGYRAGDGSMPGRLPAGKPMRSPEGGRYLLSLKDICTLQILPDLIDAGISSLKIEGRMKRPQYAAGVTAIYRKYIDLYLSEGRRGYRVDQGDLTALADLFSRGGFSEGYLRQKTGPDMMATVRPDHSGTAAAVIVKTSGAGKGNPGRLQDGMGRGSGRAQKSGKMQEGGKVVLRALEDLYQGDSLQISGKEYLMKQDVRAGKTFTADCHDFSLQGKTPAADGYQAAIEGDTVMRLRAGHLLDRLSEEYVKTTPQVPAEASAEVREGKPFLFRVSARGKEAKAEGQAVQTAGTHPLTEEAVRKQVRKTGDTPFVFERTDVEISGDCFLPVSEMNRVRRTALQRLEEKILADFRRQDPRTAHSCGAISPDAAAFCHSSDMGEEDARNTSAHPPVTASVLTEDQLRAVLLSDMVGGVYIDASMFAGQAFEKPEDVIAKVHGAGKKAYLALPYIWRRETEQTFNHFLPADKVRLFDGILLRNTDQFLRIPEWTASKAAVDTTQDRAADQAAGIAETGTVKEVIADAGIYTWNTEAQAEVRRLGATWDTCPYECTAREMSERDNRESELVVYGRQTMMVTAQCLRKNTAGCTGRPSFMTLTDRKKAGFPVRNDCAFCMNIIYNSVPLELLSAQKDVETVHAGSVRYIFTTETGEETEKILCGHLPETITRGHIRKGVM